jgi:alpha-mannosidase
MSRLTLALLPALVSQIAFCQAAHIILVQPGTGRHLCAFFSIPAEPLRSAENVMASGSECWSWVPHDLVSFYAAKGIEMTKPETQTTIQSVEAAPALIKRDGALYQPLSVQVTHEGDSAKARLFVQGGLATEVTLEPGEQTFEGFAHPVDAPTKITVELRDRDQVLASSEITLHPVQKRVIYLLHHTHVDIGYTSTQEDTERFHMEYLDRAQELIRRTDSYPPEAQFKWLPEQLWGVDSYLKEASEEQRRALFDAVKAQRIGLDAFYGNMLTGLCSPDELFAVLDFGLRLRSEYGLTIDSAMITDVPGYTWGLVPVLAQSGIKYLSLGPNPSHRIGHTRVWDDKPFYWVSPCGRYKVLVWMAGTSYGFCHVHRPTADRLFPYLRELEDEAYPYEYVQMRCGVGGDNGPPDGNLADYVKQWNEQYESPKLVLSTTSQMFHAFESRYGDQLPVVRGDFTPYWEDGAASTAADTAVNRAAVEKLLQAQALWAMLNPGPYPADRFSAAWRYAVLYDEHTWGAYNSIDEPDADFVVHQAKYKQRMALEADAGAQRLLDEAVAKHRDESRSVRAVEVFNTVSWPRTDLVVLPADMELPGDLVKAADGAVVPSQRLSTGELAFLARNVPPMGSARFTIEPGEATTEGKAHAEGLGLRNDLLQLKLNEQTGAIESLRATGIGPDLVDGEGGLGLNDYIYVEGRDPNEQRRVEQVEIDLLDRGPLVATARVTSKAPGARNLVREVRVIDGLQRMDITDTIDKRRVREKEGVHLGFPFNVPDGTVRMEMPWAVIRPEADQIEGACRNFYAVQGWVDVHNLQYGVTWATVDAPMVQVGRIRTDVSAPHDPSVWARHIEPSQTLFSYVMNNYWETNYKADQEGPTTFRYSIRPRAGLYDQMQAARFGTERTRPLIAIPVRPEQPPVEPFVRVDAAGVLISSIRPSRDGKALIIRLYAVGGEPESFSLTWGDGKPRSLYLSGEDEARGEPVACPIDLPAYGIVTLRAER